MNLKAIAEAYARRIMRNEITIDKVPASLKAQVIEILDK